MQGLAVKDQRLIDMEKEKKKLAQRFDISRCPLAVESVLVDMHSGGFASTRCASRELGKKKKGWLRVALVLGLV